MIIEPYNYSNDEALCQLFEAVFGKPMGKSDSESHFQWEYLDNPAGKAVVYIARSETGEIASVYAAIPLRMKIFSSAVMGSLSFDSMTHPHYKGKGLFTKLAVKHYEYLTNNGYDIIYGFPNGNSIKIFINNLKWFELGNFPLLVRIQDFRPLLEKYLRIRFPSRLLGTMLNRAYDFLYSPDKLHKSDSVKIYRIDGFDENFNQFWNNVRHLFPICVERDAQYLRWRYRRPEEEYRILKAETNNRIVGYAIVKNESRFGIKTGYVMDFIAMPDSRIISKLISEIIKEFRQARVDLVSVLMNAHSLYYRHFRKCGFIQVPRRFHPQEIHFGGRINISRERESNIRDARNWFISWGDTDLL
jgi:hypothetical protein